jgi:hypothetical protein
MRAQGGHSPRGEGVPAPQVHPSVAKMNKSKSTKGKKGKNVILVPSSHRTPRAPPTDPLQEPRAPSGAFQNEAGGAPPTSREEPRGGVREEDLVREMAKASFGVKHAGVSKLRPYVYPDGYERQDTPVSIIREYFDSLSKHSAAVAWAFEEFDHVLKGGCKNYMPGGSGAITSPYRDTSEKGAFAWDPLNIEAPSEGHTVYFLLVSRIDYVSRLMAMSWLPRRVRQALAAHMDTHLMLAGHMDLSGVYDDSCMVRALPQSRLKKNCSTDGM